MQKKIAPLIRNYLITGIIVSLPLVVTVWVLWFIFRSVESSLGTLLAWVIGLFTGEAIRIPGAGVVLTVTVLLLIGMVATNVVGRRLVAFGERILLKFPLIRPIYGGVKQVIDAFSSQKSSFRDVVMLEYPRKGLYVVGYVTGDATDELVARVGEPAKVVFVPTVPNPTSGFVLIVPERELIRMDMTTEGATKFLLSGGVLIPRWDPPGEAADGDDGGTAARASDGGMEADADMGVE